MLVVGEVAYVLNKRKRATGGASWFGLIEHRPLAFTVLTLLAVLVGGIAEILPMVLVKQAVPVTGASQKPYTALEQQGRDLYTREGCYVCHSQMIRPMVAEYLRYGEAARAEEFIYDHPFQWGSKRTGPDLQRIGGKYPSLWHYTHMNDPRSTSPGSNMPNYPWLAESHIDPKLAPKKLALMQKLGVPYTNQDIDDAEANQRRQANTIVADLQKNGVTVEWDNEIVALISYLQRLGRDQGVALRRDPQDGRLGAQSCSNNLRRHGVDRAGDLRAALFMSFFVLVLRTFVFKTRATSSRTVSCRCPMERKSRELRTDSKIVHRYDDIEEEDNQLPNWWLFILFATIVFMFGYWIVYHTTHSLQDPRSEYNAQVAEIKKARLAQTPLSDDAILAVVADPAARRGQGGLRLDLRRLPRAAGPGPRRPQPHRQVLDPRQQAVATSPGPSPTATPTRACRRGARCSARRRCARSLPTSSP